MKSAVIGAKAWEELWRYCSSVSPAEACGVLIGWGSEHPENLVRQIHISGFVPIANRSQQPDIRFEFDSGEWVTAFMRYREPSSGIGTAPASPLLLGTFHSHPSAPPLPSAADLAGTSAWSSLPLHLIVSLQTRTWLAFRPLDRSISYEEIHLQVQTADAQDTLVP